MDVSRRHVLGIGAAGLGMAALSPLLAACSSSRGKSSGTKSGSAGSSAAKGGGGPVALKIWAQDPGLVTAYTATAKVDTSPYQYKLSSVVQPSSTLITKALAAYSAHGAAPDILGIDITLFSRFVKSNLASAFLVDLTTDIAPIRNQFFESRWAPYEAQGKIYGVESNYPLAGYFYRSDLFKKYNVGSLDTWDDVLSAGKKLHEKYGVYLGEMGQPNGADLTWFGLFFQQRGGQFFDKDGNFAVDSTEAVDALTMMVNLVKSGAYVLVSDFYGGPGSAAVLQNKVIGNFMPSWYESILQGSAAAQKGKWALKLPPRWTQGGHKAGIWGGTAWSLSKSQKNADAAYALVKATNLTLEGQVRRFQDSAFLPTMKAAYKDPRVLGYQDPYLGGQKTAVIYSQLAADAPTQYQSANWAAMTTAVATSVDDALAGRKTPAQAIKAAAAAYKSAAK
jgi:arabinosaccharide transport system substrate-binding protein